MSVTGAASVVPQDSDGMGRRGTLFSKDSLRPLAVTTKTAPRDDDQSLLPLITKALAPLLEKLQATLLEQLQANSTDIKRMEQSIARLTEERTSGWSDRVADDLRLQINGLRATQEMAGNNIRQQEQSLEKNPVPIESISETGGTAVSTAALVHVPLQPQQQQQPQIQQRRGMMTDDQHLQPTGVFENTHQSEQAKVRSSKRIANHVKKRSTITNTNLRNLRLDAAFLEKEASINIVKAFCRRMGQMMDWWTRLEEPQRSGPLFEFVHSRKFEIIASFVIIANSITMTYAANHSMKSLETGLFVYAEWFFVFVYLLESLSKLAVHGGWIFYNEDAVWNFFDFVLVMSSLYGCIVEFLDMFGTGAGVSDSPSTGLLNLRILRLIRVVRLFKLLRVFSEVWLLVNSMISSILTLFWSLVTLVFVHYLFALLIVQDLIIFRENNKGHVELELECAILENFGSVTSAMLSLFKSLSGGVLWNTYLQILPTFSSVMFVFFVSFVQFQIVNILAAVFIHNTEKVRKPDPITQANMNQFKLQKESEELRQIVMLADHNKPGRISARELREFVEENDEVRIQLHSLGIDIDDSEKFFDLLIYDLPDGRKTDDVEIDTFVEACLRINGAAKNVTQETVLMETRALRRSQAEHNLYMKNWQTDVNQKLDMLRGRL